jgi:hypothetical protein
MRLLEEDTFLPLPPPEKKSRAPKPYIDRTVNGEWDDEDDEDERLLASAKKLAESKFKVDSFVIIDEQSVGQARRNKDEDSSPPRRAQQKKGASKQSDDSDNSPVRRPGRGMSGSDDDISPPRRMKREPVDNSDGDISPPRPSKSRRDRSTSRDTSPRRLSRNKGGSESRDGRPNAHIKREPGLSLILFQSLAKFPVYHFQASVRSGRKWI